MFNKLRIAVVIFITTVLVGVVTATPTGMVQSELNKGWRFRQARLQQWRTATVPGVVHTDLLDHGLIEDPFFRLNERSVQWVDKEDWVYETTFDIPAKMLEYKNYRLVFNGLDTYADVELNGEKILSADNMFRRWPVDVSQKLKERGNVLQIYFHSPIKIDIPKWEALPYHYEAGNDQSQNGGLFGKQVSIFARKAGYHYGWDWGPRLVTSGIWRSVVLESWNDACIEDLAFQTQQLGKRTAQVVCEVEINSEKSADEANVSIFDENTKMFVGSTICDLKQGINHIKVNFKLNNPRLWWCNGLGEPELYDFRVELSINNKLVDSRKQTTGIRTIELVRENDKEGQSFYFRLNGVRVFAKGANYIPSDNFLPRVTIADYKKTIDDAVAVHMNMLRVWGGGIYENDEFYDLCDRNGLLIWQDFMFACSLYPAEGEMLENIRLEAIDNVKRMRNHPSLAVWCGNNENQTAWFSWGWKENYERQNKAYAEKIWKQYCDQYFDVLDKVVDEYALNVPYTPSSPFASKEVAQEKNIGDRHFWGVWTGAFPISAYRDEHSRFFSEYGFQSFPEIQTVKRYAPEQEDQDILSDAMMWHQRGGKNANERIYKHLLNEYQEPKGFENLLYMTQILQADAVKIAMEAHRRDKPYCMGTLYWQINDCWPVASWSSRDYYGRWKALHYFVKNAFDDILVSPVERNGRLEVWVISDRQQPVKGKLEIIIYDMKGKRVNNVTRNVRLKADESLKVTDQAVKELIGNYAPGDVVVYADFVVQNEKKHYTNNCFLVKQKEMNYQEAVIDPVIEPKEYGFRVTLRTNTFARGVFMELKGQDYFFNKNFFDLFPGHPVTLEVETSLSPQEFEKQLCIKTLRDAYK